MILPLLLLLYIIPTALLRKTDIIKPSLSKTDKNSHKDYSRAVKVPRTEAGYRVTDGNIAAIDFGTTSVSLAYTTKKYEDVNSFDLDPAGSQSTRVLSVILLRKEEAKLKVVAFGRDARRKFSQLRPGDYPNYLYFERIKMLLKREQVGII